MSVIGKQAMTLQNVPSDSSQRVMYITSRLTVFVKDGTEHGAQDGVEDDVSRVQESLSLCQSSEVGGH